MTIERTNFGQRRALMGCSTTFFTALLWTGVAQAQVSTNYLPTGCHGTVNAQQANIGTVSGGRFGTYISASTSTSIACPIMKTTSGSSVGTPDNISNVAIYLHGGTATCDVTVYSADPWQSWPYNVVETVPGSGSGSATINISTTTVNYWGGDYAYETWYYAELHCTFSGGLDGYTVTEQGSNQPNQRIVGPSWCKPSPEANNYEYATSTSGWGGFVEALGSSSGFNIHCPWPTGAGGTWMEIALSPSLRSTGLMACTQDSYPWATDTVPYTGSEYPPEVIDMSSEGGFSVNCAMQHNPPDGDGGLFSLRTSDYEVNFTL